MPCPARAPRGRCRAGRAARPAFARSSVSLRPFSAASRASRSFCAVARERPSIPVMTSSSEVAPEDHGDRVGLALDVELAQQGARSDAGTRRASGARSRFAASRRPPPGRARSSGHRGAPARSGRGRVTTPPRRAAGAPSTRSSEARRPAWPAIGPVCAAPIVGDRSGEEDAAQNGRAEQRPRRGRRSHKAETVAKKRPSTRVKRRICRDFSQLSVAPVIRPCYHHAFAGVPPCRGRAFRRSNQLYEQFENATGSGPHPRLTGPAGRSGSSDDAWVPRRRTRSSRSAPRPRPCWRRFRSRTSSSRRRSSRTTTRTCSSTRSTPT